ncbi:hypothetical protein JKP88DRAFT_266038 [Tribonema minus]|uniref:Uncharacterized protein n=1 Tax=Tribonema minus TaxID=303371 RepID=A0A836C812_9STRA|nr:hypothetical protein JKP88DRAFT_266038 [Tribonema minus]
MAAAAATARKGLLCMTLLAGLTAGRAFVFAGAGRSIAARGAAARGMALRSDDDREGRKLGNPRVFEYLVEYPCEFQIKVVGFNDASLADDLAAIVAATCEVEVGAVTYTTRETESGKYSSVTLTAPVASPAMLYECYAKIGEDARVKFKF